MDSLALYGSFLWPLLGFGVGLLGTLIGAGGGFLLVPILIFLMPNETADRLTAISMAVVFFNALSGSVAYFIMKKVDFSSGWRFALAAMPGALLGAVATQYISRVVFSIVLGLFLILMAVFLLWKSRKSQSQNDESIATSGFILPKKMVRRGSILSTGVGFISSALGIGGGIVHVPAMIYLLGYPVHIATATSHFVLACTSLVAVGEHVYHGSYDGNIHTTILLAGGAIVGAQIGARFSKLIKGNAIVQCLGVALVFVGIRIVIKAIY